MQSVIGFVQSIALSDTGDHLQLLKHAELTETDMDMDILLFNGHLSSVNVNRTMSVYLRFEPEKLHAISFIC